MSNSDVAKVKAFPGPLNGSEKFYAVQDEETGLFLYHHMDGVPEWRGTDAKQAVVFGRSTIESLFGAENVTTVEDSSND